MNMETETVINMDNEDWLSDYETKLPKNRKHLIESMVIFNQNYQVMNSGQIGEPMFYIPHLVSSFLCAFFPIMGVHLFNDFKKLSSIKYKRVKMQHLNSLNLSYQDHLGGIINFRPEDIFKYDLDDGWNYFGTHRCSYNLKTNDLDFVSKNVKGVSYENTLQFLPEGFYKMTPSKLEKYFKKQNKK
jgi:hypothetical protein